MGRPRMRHLRWSLQSPDWFRSFPTRKPSGRRFSKHELDDAEDARPILPIILFTWQVREAACINVCTSAGTREPATWRMGRRVDFAVALGYEPAGTSRSILKCLSSAMAPSEA